MWTINKKRIKILKYALLIHSGIYSRIKVLHNNLKINLIINLKINLIIMEDVIIKTSILKSKACSSSLFKYKIKSRNNK